MSNLSQFWKSRTQMQTLMKPNKVVIKVKYRMKTMDVNIIWMKLTHLLSIYALNLLVSFCTSTFTSKNINFQIYMLEREKERSLMYANASNNTLFYTQVNMCVVRRVHPLNPCTTWILVSTLLFMFDFGTFALHKAIQK